VTEPTRIPRRGFLGRLAAATALLTTVSPPSIVRAQQAQPVAREDLDKWLDDLKGKHRQIFDVLTPAKASEGAAFARNFLTANADAYGLADADVNAVISFRHEAFAFGLNDAMWLKYKLGELLKFNDPRTSAPAVRNTLLGAAPDNGRISSSLAGLHAHGGVFPVCGMAMRAYAGSAATAANTDAQTARADFQANLIPGALEVAAGVIALNRAQEHGFSYVFVG
jgi:hypothetical protein